MLKQTPILSLGFAAILLISTSARGDDLDVRSERQRKEKEIAELPVLPAMPLRDALVFRIIGSDIALYTHLPPTTALSKVNIDGMTGICTGDVRMLGNDPAPTSFSTPYRPSVFSFVHWVFDEHAATISSTTITLSPINLQIVKDSETATVPSQVSLIQPTAGMSPDEAAIRLRVTVDGREICARSARNFVTLRRQFPADTTKYLEPIFREIGADTILFTPDPKLIWQVFSADAKPDPAVEAKIKAILPRLDSDDFHERESASADLQLLGEPAAICLWKTNRTSLSAEQNSRVDAFLKAFQPVTEQDIERLRNDPTFLVECLYETDDFLAGTALQQLSKVTDRRLHFDNTLRGESRRSAINTLREAVAPPSTQSDSIK